MLQSVKSLNGFSVHALDGEIGSVEDCLFDDQKWTVRFLAVQTGSWLTGREVVISPVSVRAIDPLHRRIEVSLTRQHVEDSPSLDSERPVSRRFERAYFNYFRWPYYWTGAGVWGIAPEPAGLPIREEVPGGETEEPAHAPDPHLRSCKETLGYAIEAVDGEFGGVEDFLMDPASWALRYLLVDTMKWWPSKRTLVAPRWIDSISWYQGKLRAGLSREAIKTSPPYNPKYPIDRDYEQKLHQHYRKRGYWEDKIAA